MEDTEPKDPKDEQITNKDDSATNKDGDNYLEKGKQPSEQNKPDEVRVPTVTPDNGNGDPGPPEKDKETEDEKDRQSTSFDRSMLVEEANLPQKGYLVEIVGFFDYFIVLQHKYGAAL
jgi:hypothetical protein